jgi:hypothetical protein
MTQISSTFRSAWLSSRTADYLAALSREGDKFDYWRWLQQVRREEGQAKRRLPTITEQNRAGQMDASVSIVDRRETSSNEKQFKGRVPIPTGIRRSHPKLLCSISGTRITRRLHNVREAWSDFQANRTRDAVYGYLSAVFGTTMHYKVRRKTKKLLRYAFKFAKLPFDEKADPFTAVVRCTSDDNADTKSISKWARALRYVASRKVSATPVEHVYEGSRWGQCVCKPLRTTGSTVNPGGACRSSPTNNRFRPES